MPPVLRQRAQRKRDDKIRRAPVHELDVPERFSLVDNPQEFVAFLEELEQRCALGFNVRVDLGSVTELTAEAAAVLMSRVMDDRYSKGMAVFGNGPKDPDLARILGESGFYDHVEVHRPPPKSNGVGQIRTRKNYKVDAAGSDRLLQQVDQVIPGNEFAWDGIQRLIVESMNNTENHAGGRKKGRERWWLSVYCDRDANVARFCFFDNGVGIFESLKKKGALQKLFRLLSLKDRTDLLKDLLAGKVRSSTGLGYRGKGLPKIAEAHARKQFRRLVILSNDVYADVEAGDFRSLPVPFSGTFLYWEHHGI